VERRQKMDNIKIEKLNKIINLAKDIKRETDDKSCWFIADQIVAIVEKLVKENKNEHSKD
jgi:hypothetical protein